ncbi:MAG: nuclear transport factor 2 family protein [Candidatus Hydrogenedentes bacterium]|nr:nuclear transport factor 2 family protein [Candidatus Hydrogenedentota bacterium]
MRTLWFTTLGILMLSLTGCEQQLPVDIPGLNTARMTDEQQIAAVLDDVHRGMESKRIYKVLAHVSPSYQDIEGRNYEIMREYLSGIMRDYRNITIRRTRPRILVHGDRARAVETFGTVAEPFNTETTQPLNIQGSLSVYLEREGDEWKIIEWGPMR